MTSLRLRFSLAGAAYPVARSVVGRGGIYQLILWLRRWDMGEPSFARLLAAPRAARPSPPDRVLNAAGNSAIGLNADRAEFQNASHCGGLATRVANEFGVTLGG